MRTAVSIAFVLFGATAAQAHSYLIGNLEIFHPAIMVPEANFYCTCAQPPNHDQSWSPKPNISLVPTSPWRVATRLLCMFE